MSLFDRVITRKRYRELNLIFTAFDWTAIQEAFSLMAHMHYMKVPENEFKRWVTKKQEENIEIAEQSAKYMKGGNTGPPCPECGINMILFPVNSMSCDQIGGRYRSQMVCPDWENCGYEKFSTKSFEMLARENERVRSRSNPNRIKQKSKCGGCGKDKEK